MNLLPSRAVMRRLAEYNTSWTEVATDLQEPEDCEPVEGYKTRLICRGRRFIAYVEPVRRGSSLTWLAVGVRPREQG